MNEQYLSMADAAKVLRYRSPRNNMVMGRNELFDFLRNERVLHNHGHEKNLPAQQYVSRGYFAVKVKQLPTGRVKLVTTVSIDGLRFLDRLLSSRNYSKAL